MPTTFTQMLAGAKLPEKTVPICLRGDLVAEFEDLERQLEEAVREDKRDSLEDPGPVAVAERMQQLRAEMAEFTYPFRLRAMPRTAWREFVAQHPPRQQEQDGEQEIDPRDRIFLLNTDTFWPALIRASVYDPQLTDDQWRELLGDDEEERRRREAESLPTEDGVLTDKQFSALADAAWGLNRRDVNVPFSPAASRLTRSSGIE